MAKMVDFCSDVQFWVLVFLIRGFLGFANFCPGLRVLIPPEAPVFKHKFFFSKANDLLAFTDGMLLRQASHNVDLLASMPQETRNKGPRISTNSTHDLL